MIAALWLLLAYLNFNMGFFHVGFLQIVIAIYVMLAESYRNLLEGWRMLGKDLIEELHRKDAIIEELTKE